MKAIRSKFLALAATSTALAVALAVSLTASAGAQILTAPAGTLSGDTSNFEEVKVTYLDAENAEFIATEIIKRAEANGVLSNDHDVNNFNGTDSFTYTITDTFTYTITDSFTYTVEDGTFEFPTFAFMSMIRDLLAAEPTVAPTTKTEFHALCSAITSELILELFHVRTYRTSTYLDRRTLWKVRDRQINDALLALLIPAAG